MKRLTREEWLIRVRKDPMHRQDPDMIDYMKSVTSLKDKIEVVTEVPIEGIMYIDNPSEEVQLTAVKANAWGLQYINKPSKEVQLEAVKQNPHSIMFIDNPSEEVQLAAVKSNGYSIGSIKVKDKISLDVQIAAVRQEPNAYTHINKLHPTVMKEIALSY